MVWALGNVSDWPKLKSVYNSYNKIFNNSAICLIPILQYTFVYTVLTLDYFNISGKLRIISVSPLLFTQGQQLKYFFFSLKISLTPNILDFCFYQNKLCHKDSMCAWVYVGIFPLNCLCFPWKCDLHIFMWNVMQSSIQKTELLYA